MHVHVQLSRLAIMCCSFPKLSPTLTSNNSRNPWKPRKAATLYGSPRCNFYCLILHHSLIVIIFSGTVLGCVTTQPFSHSSCSAEDAAEVATSSSEGETVTNSASGPAPEFRQVMLHAQNQIILTKVLTQDREQVC